MKVRLQLESKPASTALEVVDLAKTFRTSWGRRVIALDGVGFGVAEGEIFGLLGPNGAGKSTTLKLVLGLLKPSRGGGTLLGHPLGSVEARRRVGFLPENPYFYDYLTAHEFLDTCASLSSLPREGRRGRVAALLERVGLDPGESRRLRKFSKGMLQRVGLAQALIHDPELVILDEPMSGLDPVGRHQVRELILELKAEGKTVIFSSHVLTDVEALCDRVGILVQGKLRRTSRVGDLLAPARAGFEIQAAELPATLEARWREEGVARATGDRIVINAESRAELEQRVRQVLDAGGSLLGVKPVRVSLENVFLAETQVRSDAPPDRARMEGAA